VKEEVKVASKPEPVPDRKVHEFNPPQERKAPES
jgi:hypothetical protein